MNRRDDIRGGQGRTATENPELDQNETVSAFGEVDAKRAQVAAEARRDPESGSVATEQSYLQDETRKSDKDREREAKRADINNDAGDQHD